MIANSEGLYLSDELPLIFFIVQTLGVGNNTSHMGRERLSRHSGIDTTTFMWANGRRA